MKDKVVSISIGKEIYILDEINYADKKFIYGVECNNSEDAIEPLTDNYYFLEVKENNGDLILDNIDDPILSDEVSKIFLSRIKDL